MNPYRSSPRQATVHVSRLGVEGLFALALVTLIAFFGGCSAAQQGIAWTVLKDTTGAVCPLVVQATQPGLAPLCVGLSELEVVIQALTSASAGAGADAGLAGAAAPLTNDALYQAILAHRAAQPTAKP